MIILKLYKYCPWGITKNEHIRDNLLNSVLYFQAPSLQNDPFELFPSIQTNSPEKEVKKHIAKIYQKDGLSKEKAQRHAALEFKRNPYFKNTEGRKLYAHKFVQGIKEHVGICSFTTEYDNLLMWAHYADFHKGICLQFDFPSSQSIILQEETYPLPVLPMKVQYNVNRPKFPIFNRTIENINDYFLTKSKDWEYENEYRAIVRYVGRTHYQPHFLTGIIAGCRMDPQGKDMEELITIVTKMKWQPRVYHATLDNDIFGLKIVQIYPSQS